MAVPLLCLIIFVQIMQNLHFLIAAAVVKSQMQRRLVDDSGFISIDCGLGGGFYYDSAVGLYYTSDEKYISTGKNMGISPTFYDELHEDLYKTVRSFPDGRRNCYNLYPLQPNNKYLIRARFMYGNYDGGNSIPGFDVYIGVNFWFSVTLTSMDSRLFQEIIHVATTESIDVCLLNTGQGTPFISILELRPLDSPSYPASADFSLTVWIREDIGGLANTQGSYIVKDDAYDREWYRSPQWTWEVINTTESFDDSHTSPFKVPTSVLSTAGEQNNGLANMTVTFKMNNSTAVYAFWHFAELELLGSNDTREFNIFVPGYTFGPISPNYLQLTTVSSPIISLNGSEPFWYTLMKTNKSSLYPIINALELYTVLNLPVSPTNQVDADAITAIKDMYKVPRIWQGDPCLPVNYQWDGLHCTYDNNNPPRISSLSLPLSNLTGDLPPSLSNLTSLKYLNLSKNGFTGKIPEFLAYLPSLNVIDLTGNNLMGPVPLELAEKASNRSIELRLAGNPDVCNSYPCEEKTEVNKKRHHFIIPVLTFVASVSLFVVIVSIFLAYRWRKKQGVADRGIKSKNKQFNSSDIVRITGNFREVLGRGGFATVYYGALQDGIEVAVKVLNNASSAITMKQFCVEAELLTRIHHVHLVSLIGYCDEYANMAFVYEYMSCGNLQMHLSERNEHPLSWNARLQVSVDAAQGLDYLHSGCQPPIIHRDVKPANILLDEMGHAKIADFGLSRFFIAKSQGTASKTDVAGTPGYLDPEYCQLHTFSEKSDVYGFGIVLLQLLTGQQAFIKDPNNGDCRIHIINWVSPMIESGDIMAIVDKRVQGDLIGVNSAWKFLEIAMECVKPAGNQRPRMSEVVADLKMCYASQGFHEQNLVVGVDNGNHYMNSSQALRLWEPCVST